MITIELENVGPRLIVERMIIIDKAVHVSISTEREKATLTNSPERPSHYVDGGGDVAPRRKSMIERTEHGRA